MPPPLPEQLGRYQILEEVGRGAMGVVYLARDPLIGREVALKTFHIGLSLDDREGEQFRARFIREAQSAGILSHQNIVTIHDVVEQSEEGLTFIAMEYVRGTNLKQVLQIEGPPELDTVVEVVAQVAEGLDYAHSQGVIHRDVKPANILITAERLVKLTDFGIARLRSSNLTLDGQLLGTPNYMAPEQIQGEATDHRADVFSLGVVLFEMLTGEKPFKGENLTQVTHRIVHSPFELPADHATRVPTPLMTVLEKALAKDPDERYASTGVLASDLSEAAAAVRRDSLNETQVILDERHQAPPLPPPPAGDDGGPATAPGEPRSLPVDQRPTVELTPEQLAAGRSEAARWAGSTEPPPSPADGDGGDGDGDRGDGTRPSGIGAADGSAPPVPAPMPASGAGGPGRSSERPAERSSGRPPWLVPALAAAAVLLLVVVVGTVWILGRGAEPDTAAEASPDGLEAVPVEAPAGEVGALLAEATRLLATDRPEEALARVEEAERLAPDEPAVATLRTSVEQRLLLDEGARREIDATLEEARTALEAGRWSTARARALEVLDRDPDREEAVTIAERAEEGLAEARRRQAAREAAAAESEDERAAADEPEPAAVPEPVEETEPVSTEATLSYRFVTALPEGVLTIYFRGRQLVREPFRFYEREGLLRNRPTSGSVTNSYVVDAGPGEIRVLVALPGEPARSRVLEGNFPGGSRRQLEMVLDEDGGLSARLE